MSGALLVAGTTSDAGKSVVTAGLCRWLARQGVRVAPFKAQNMSLNSWVTADGAEIGRAQVMQAAAAGVPPEARMNPVLLKPGSDTRSQVVVLGHPLTDVDALGYRPLKARLMETVLDSLADLRSRFDVVICEGAGSPTEINLRSTDIANLGLARAAGLPVLVVGDIDRGGVFAALYGTLALLEPADQALVAGFVINKFRGSTALLDPGLRMLTELTGRPTLGVLPWVSGLELDVEDSLSMPAVGSARSGDPDAQLRVAAIRLPRLSNGTDLDALAVEPGVAVALVDRPAEVAEADLVVLPGTRATVADLDWLRRRGLDVALTERARTGQPVLGICGGFQMLAETITDLVESRLGTVAGLRLLPTEVEFAAEKILGRPTGSAYGEPVEGYEIHHGRTSCGPLPPDGEPFLDGCRVGAVWGTTWHGALENDGFRRAFLADVAARTGSPWAPSGAVSFAAVRQRRLDVLADLVADHLDQPMITDLLERGVPSGLRVLPPGAPQSPADGAADLTRGFEETMELPDIADLDEAAIQQATARQLSLTKPPGSLGRLEDLGIKLAGIAAQVPPPVPARPAVAVFVGDHGVHAQGVSPWPQLVTGQMVANFLAGGAVINAVARQVGAEVAVVDVGMTAESAAVAAGLEGLRQRNVRAGTDDLSTGPAMSRAEAEAAVAVGRAVAAELIGTGVDLLVTGDMGIANTTPSAALVGALLGRPATDVTGRGTGIDDATIALKQQVVQRALDRLAGPDSEPVIDPLRVLAEVGGLEHAAIVGLLLEGASRRIPVVLDGVIACSAALVAARLAPSATAFWIAGHRSSEPAATLALAELGLDPLLDLGMRLGEGSGGLAAVPLIQVAARVLAEVATFEEAEVSSAEEPER